MRSPQITAPLRPAGQMRGPRRRLGQPCLDPVASSQHHLPARGLAHGGSMRRVYAGNHPQRGHAQTRPSRVLTRPGCGSFTNDEPMCVQKRKGPSSRWFNCLRRSNHRSLRHKPEFLVEPQRMQLRRRAFANLPPDPCAPLFFFPGTAHGSAPRQARYLRWDLITNTPARSCCVAFDSNPRRPDGELLSVARKMGSMPSRVVQALPLLLRSVSSIKTMRRQQVAAARSSVNKRYWRSCENSPSGCGYRLIFNW